MEISRIPKYDCATPDGMASWFLEMAERGLIFHPEDSPDEVYAIETGARTFTGKECTELEFILSAMFDRHGDTVCETAFKIVAQKIGTLSALDS